MIELYTPLSNFCAVVADDPRIGATHVSLFLALLQQCSGSGGHNPFSIDRVNVMRYAKIRSRHTFNRCINDLQNYGYITYSPAANTFSKSMVELKTLTKEMGDGQK